MKITKMLRTSLLTLSLLGILQNNIYAGEIEQSAFIERLYQNILNRNSDTTGMNTWMNTIQTKSATQVAMGFLNSPELTNKNLSDEEFINILYQTLFDRLADSGGKNDWLDKMSNGRTKQSVMFGFFQSDEFKNLTNKFGVTQILPTDAPSLTGVESYVDRFYKLVLKRNYDENGFNDWVSKLTNKLKDPTQIASGFLFSNEYTNQNEDNSTFLDTCYKAFFGRDADLVGKNDWLNKIAQGYTRQQIFEGFTGSQEFTNLVNSFDLNGSNKTKIRYKGLEYGIVTSPITGKKWLDRNLGASEVCTQSRSDFDSNAKYITSQINCFGDYYQWGRLADGHEKSNSATTKTSSPVVINAGDKFITSSDWTSDDTDGALRKVQWSKIDGTGICPVRFRVPTFEELSSETIAYTGTNNAITSAIKVKNSTTAFQNFLKLPVAGQRTSAGQIYQPGVEGKIWTSSLINYTYSPQYIEFNSFNAGVYSTDPSYAFPVRCIQGN